MSIFFFIQPRYFLIFVVFYFEGSFFKMYFVLKEMEMKLTVGKQVKQVCDKVWILSTINTHCYFSSGTSVHSYCTLKSNLSIKKNINAL